MDRNSNLLVVKVVFNILTTVKRSSSPHEVSAILLQKSRNQENFIIDAYSSRPLTSAEKNYSQLERECLAIVIDVRKTVYIFWVDLLQFTATIRLL